MVYRARHAERRLAHYADSEMADYISMAKYARYRPDLGRREVFAEGVERVRDMHLEFFAGRLESRMPASLPADVAELAGENAASSRPRCAARASTGSSATPSSGWQPSRSCPA